MEALAQLKFLRSSSRKVKLILDLVRGQRVSRALAQLGVVPQAAARPVAKLLASALANARQKSGAASGDDWWIARAEVGQGPRLKRSMPRAMGRATPILRPTCHIRIALSDTAPRRSPKNIL